MFSDSLLVAWLSISTKRTTGVLSTEKLKVTEWLASLLDVIACMIIWVPGEVPLPTKPCGGREGCIATYFFIIFRSPERFA